MSAAPEPTLIDRALEAVYRGEVEAATALALASIAQDLASIRRDIRWQTRNWATRGK